jgi:hypothetical protein
MRLLEPLNGLKISGGHYLMHFVFFLSMMCIDTNIEGPKHHVSTIALETGVNATESMILDHLSDYEELPLFADIHVYNLLHSTSHESHEELSTMDVKKHELKVFKIMIWFHLCCGTLILFIILLKDMDHHNIAQYL